MPTESWPADIADTNRSRTFHRACDYCRSKKVRCDGLETDGEQCSRCVARRTECTYGSTQHVRKNNSDRYVKELESRIKQMEKVLKQLHPDVDLPTELQTRTPEERSPFTSTFDSHERTPRDREKASTGPSSINFTPNHPTGTEHFEYSDDEESGEQRNSAGTSAGTAIPQPRRYHGKSSNVAFVRSVFDLKDPHSPLQGQGTTRPSEWRSWWTRADGFGDEDPMVFEEFPPDDLLITLVDLYFRKVNDTVPLLHEPTFRRNLVDGVHLRVGGFGATVLLVCAIASRFTQDPRVHFEGPVDRQSAGWRWFREVEKVHRVPIAPARLYDIQIYALMCLYIQGTRTPQASWSLSGIGIRIAMDVGAHRRKMYTSISKVEGELWRRAFWVLIHVEWLSGYVLGRSSFIHDEDMDLGLPTEVDDEFWTTSDGQPYFQQPPDKPSKISFYVHSLRLFQILAFATRTIYSINKAKAQLGRGDSQWEQRMVSELDSALNKWADTLPAHLRWNPDRKDNIAFMQSTILYAQFHQFQIAVHRPFMAPSQRNSPLHLPSLIICTNAARSSIRAIETLYKRMGNPYHRNAGLIFVCGVVLMMNILRHKHGEQSTDVQEDAALVQRCVEMLDTLKYEIDVSDALSDVLKDLLSAVEQSGGEADQAADGQLGDGMAENQYNLSTSDEPWMRLSNSPTAESGEHRAHKELDPFHWLRLPEYTTSVDNPPIHPPVEPDKHQGLTMEDLSCFYTPKLQMQPSQRAQCTPNAGTQTSGVQSNQELYASGRSMFSFGSLRQTERTTGPSSATSSLPSFGLYGGNASSAGVSATSQGTGSEQSFALLDDALTKWSTAPPDLGWDDWGVYISRANSF